MRALQIFFSTILSLAIVSCAKDNGPSHYPEDCGMVGYRASISYMIVDSNNNSIYSYPPSGTSPNNLTQSYFINGLGAKTPIELGRTTNGSVLFELYQPSYEVRVERDSSKTDTLCWIIDYQPEDKTDTIFTVLKYCFGPTYIRYNSQVLYEYQNVDFEHLSNSSFFSVLYSR